MPEPQEEAPIELRRGPWPALIRLVRPLWATPGALLTSLSVIIGVITGLGSTGFAYLLRQAEYLYFGKLWMSLDSETVRLIVLPLLPASGAVLVGLIICYFAPEAEGHGVPEVMDAIVRKRGRIRPRVTAAKAVASALTIGSGGSAGTEGPIIQIGAAVGSSFGQWLKVNPADMRVLIGCGAAAGISSIFNAPIAGVLFAMEVLLRDVSLRSFVPIIVAAVLSTTVTQAILGHNRAIFPVPVGLTEEGLTAPVYAFDYHELGNYVVLGLICGLVAVAFIRLLYKLEDVFHALPVHPVFRPVVGGVCVGLISVGLLLAVHGHMPSRPRGLTAEPGTAHGIQVGVREAMAAVPEQHPPPIMGNGYPVIRQMLEKAAYTDQMTVPWTIWVFLLLWLGKLAVTSITLGSGGSGGVFAPSLFMGATAGGAFGILLHTTGWFAHSSPGGYALVGMAAVVAATIHAPMTGILILFEMTQDYKVILPIMLASVAALTVANRLEPASIYTMKLLRRGVRYGATAALRELQRVFARDIPRQPALKVSADDPVSRLINLARSSLASAFVVVDGDGKYVGIVPDEDLRVALLEPEAVPLLIASELTHKDVPTISLDDTLDVVVDKFTRSDQQCLPVLDPHRPDRPEGLLSRTAVMNRYHHVLAYGAG
jgi:CIC family chloride channel protein